MDPVADVKDWIRTDLRGTRRSWLGEILCRLYGKTEKIRFRNIILSFVLKIEEGELYSFSARKIFNDYHKVRIGAYSYGGCFGVGAMDKYTSIGRYTSIARMARVLNRNHPMQFKSQHPFFFNPALNICINDYVPYSSLQIGHDVWIGHNACILPNVRSIGTGAVIGAGTIVNADIPPYAVVVGVPGRLVKYRFPEKVREQLLTSRWWEKTIDEIKVALDEYTRPYHSIE